MAPSPPPTPSARILQMVLENLPGIVWTTDLELRYTAIFGAGLATIKISGESIVGQTLFEFEPGITEQTPVVVAHRRALAGETAVFEQAWREYIVQGTVRPLRNDRGEIIGCIGSCQNVTAHKQAEAALRASEQRYRAIVEATTELVARFTPDLILTYVNEAYCRFFGATREELLGTSLLRFVSDEHQALTHLRLTQFTPQTPVCHNEEQVVTRTGEVRWLHWINQALFDAQGQITEIQSTGRDITEQKEAESQLQREQEHLKRLLELYDRDRQLVSYEIHDGLAQHLAGAMMHLETARQLNVAMPEAAKRACDLVRTLLARSLEEARRLISDLRPPILDESGLVAAIEHLVHDQRFETDLKITFTHHVALPRLAAPLENALFRIVQESVTNAVRHSRSKTCQISLDQVGENVRLEIQDQGVGFDPTSPRPGGFGLHGIHERARLLGGQAVIESVPGRGTRIVVEIPMLRPGEA